MGGGKQERGWETTSIRVRYFVNLNRWRQKLRIVAVLCVPGCMVQKDHSSTPGCTRAIFLTEEREGVGVIRGRDLQDCCMLRIKVSMRSFVNADANISQGTVLSLLCPFRG